MWPMHKMGHGARQGMLMGIAGRVVVVFLALPPATYAVTATKFRFYRPAARAA